MTPNTLPTDAMIKAGREIADKLWILRCDSRDDAARVAADNALEAWNKALAMQASCASGDDVERVSQAIRSKLGLKGQQITDMGLDDKIDDAAHAAIAALSPTAAQPITNDVPGLVERCNRLLPTNLDALQDYLAEENEHEAYHAITTLRATLSALQRNEAVMTEALARVRQGLRAYMPESRVSTPVPLARLIEIIDKALTPIPGDGK